jgi:hypothetical protein
MKRLVLFLLLCSLPCHARHVKSTLLKVAEHVSLGVGVEITVSRVAGGPNKYAAGIVAGGLVAGFKEGSDAVAGRDTKKQAAWHAATILAGAVIAAAAKH